MLLKVFVIAHIVACCWWGICSAMSTHTWYDNPNLSVVKDGDTVSLRDDDLSAQYFTSLYWSYTTITATGYGDIVPSNVWERTLASAVFIFGACVFGYAASSFGRIFQSINRYEALVDEQVARVNEFLHDANADRATHVEVRLVRAPPPGTHLPHLPRCDTFASR